MAKKSNGNANKDSFFRISRGDVQFTTGGSGISHSEYNEHTSDPVHFLQIWATPWKNGLMPRYHDLSIDEDSKRNKFATVLSPLKAGLGASAEEEKAALPSVDGTIPIHADLVMGASIIDAGSSATWHIGGNGATKSKSNRKTYIHLPMTKGGSAMIQLPNGVVLEEGDGAFVSKVNAGDELKIDSVGDAEAEVVVLDSN